MDFYLEASSRPFTHGQISWYVLVSFAITLAYFFYTLLKQLEKDVNRQREILETVRNRGQELKSKMKQGNNFVSSKLAELEQKFKDFSTSLNQKQER